MSSPIRSAIEPFLKRLKSHLDQVKPIMAKNKILSDAECELMKLKMKLLRKSINTLEKKNAGWTKYIQEIHNTEDRRAEEANHNGFKFENKFFYEWIKEAQSYVDLIEATILSEDKAVPVNQPPAAVNHGHGAKDDTLHISLPKNKLPEFNGDVHGWMTFWQRFDSSVHSRNFRDVDKMELLLGCLKGDAKDAISNIKISNENYDLAVKILKKMYGDERMLIEQFEAELMTLPTVNEVGLSLKKNADKIEQICRQLKLLGVNVEDSSFLTTIIKSKLPRNVLLNLVTKERESLKKWTTADWRMALENFVNDREAVFQTMKHFKRGQFGVNENVKKDEEKQPRWRDAQITRMFVVSSKDDNKRSSNAKIKDEIAELLEKAAVHEEIAIQFEEFEDEKARLSNENTKLQNKVKVLKELDKIHQSKLNTQKSEIVTLQAKLEEVLAEAKINEIAMKKDEEMNIQLKTFSEENLTLRNEMKALKEVKREQQAKLNTQQIQLETLKANLEQSLKETARKEAERIEEASKNSLQNHQLMKILAESNEQKEQLSTECKKYQSQIAQLQEEAMEQRQRIDTLLNEIEAKTRQNKTLEVNKIKFGEILATREPTEDGMKDKFQKARNGKSLLEENMSLEREVSALNEEPQQQEKHFSLDANLVENTAKLLKIEAKCNEKGIIQLIFFHLGQSTIDEECHIKCPDEANCFGENFSWISGIDMQILSKFLEWKKYILIFGIVVLGSLILLIAWKIKPMFRHFKLLSLIGGGSPQGDESTPKWMTKLNTPHTILIEDDAEKIWPKALTEDPCKTVCFSASTSPKTILNEFEEIEYSKFFMQFLKMIFNKISEKNQCPKGMELCKIDEERSNQMCQTENLLFKCAQISGEIKFNENESQNQKSEANPELEPPVIWPRKRQQQQIRILPDTRSLYRTQADLGGAAK